jgi:hypothetical protein
LSGGTAKRPALLRCLKALQPGDTLTVWDLDHLGRSLRDLMSKTSPGSFRPCGNSDAPREVAAHHNGSPEPRPRASRIPDDLAEWLNHAARRTGVPKGRIIRQELEKARDSAKSPFLRLAGAVAGPAEISTRKGFSRK